MTTTALAEQTAQFVKDELSGNDASHDWAHIERVRNTALHLAEKEGIEDVETVELAALLHDIDDWKYSGSETAGIEKARAFLLSHGHDAAKTEKVCEIIEKVSFRKELAGSDSVVSPELAVVQDADRLDAIGAIGIARTFSYGGLKKRPFYDPANPPEKDLTKEKYMNSNGATINHFYEKLLKLKDMMKTKSGRELAEGRHAYMEEFLERFFGEWSGKM
mmetsp:Transcript_13143/g.34379  ORF Transcript_13143/g.34379 Transcript_13143/m.34379 type:complete len:219 (-) Transcript_13143:1650-2306(-)